MHRDDAQELCSECSSLCELTVTVQIQTFQRGAEMNQTTIQRNPATTLGLRHYVVGVGSAWAITLFDAVRNDSSSALLKTAGFFYRYGANKQLLWTILAAVILGLVAALTVYAYEPKSKKEAFAVGLSIISIFNATLTSPFKMPQIGLLDSSSNGLISSALAQASDTVVSKPQDVWFFISGPKALRHPETRVAVFSADDNRLVTTQIEYPAFRLSLQPGQYFVQINHTGFRSSIAKIAVTTKSNAYRITMDPISYSAIANILGAANVPAEPDEKLGAAVEAFIANCHDGITDVAALKALGQPEYDSLKKVPEFAPCFR
jgi:hypothetical protein